MSPAGPEAPIEADRPWRWVITGMVFAGTLINYIDRQTIAVLSPVLCRDLGLSNTQYGAIGTVFLLAYALSMWLWGGVFDRLGNRAGYTVAMVIWSISETAHALTRGLVSLSVVRGFLGLGEAGNWPGATRTVAAWFAPRQRALGMGLVNAGASIGPAIAPAVIIWLQIRFGWKTTFVATGLLGLVWLGFWLPLYPRRSAHATAAAPALHRAIPWPVLVRQRQFWGIVLARFFGDPIWWLYLNWLPKYLADVRHFSLREIGASTGIPFLFAAGGSIFGGWFSGFLIGRGWSVNLSRKTAIVIATLLLPAGVGAAYVASPAAAIALFSVTLFAFQFWVSNVQTLPSDFFPVGAVGSLAGFSGTAAGLGSAIFVFSTGWVVDHFSYTPILIVAGVLAPVATVTLFWLAGPVRRLEAFPE